MSIYDFSQIQAYQNFTEVSWSCSGGDPCFAIFDFPVPDVSTVVFLGSSAIVVYALYKVVITATLMVLMALSFQISPLLSSVLLLAFLSRFFICVMHRCCEWGPPVLALNLSSIVSSVVLLLMLSLPLLSMDRMETALVASNSNIVERANSRANLISSVQRRPMSSQTVQMTLFLHQNKSLWPDARSVQTILDGLLDLDEDSDAFENDEDED